MRTLLFVAAWIWLAGRLVRLRRDFWREVYRLRTGDETPTGTAGH